MGRNRDFCELFNIPEVIECPRCRRETHSGLDEYDIDCDEPFADKDGIMTFKCHCGICEHDFDFKVQIKIIGSKY